MDEIIYHSFYRDSGFRSLKHAILYFDKIVIPKNVYPVIFGENNENMLLAQSVPEDVADQIDYLINQKIVQQKEFLGFQETDIGDYIKAVETGLAKQEISRNYSFDEIQNVCSYLNINPKDSNSLREVQSIAILASALCLMEVSKSKRICCTDNRIVYDSISCGLKNALELAEQSVKNQGLEVRRLSTNLLAQKVMSIDMPSFEFKSFDDVLEIKEKHKEELIALDSYLFDLSDKIELLPFEPGYDDALDKVIERRIQPAITNLRRSVTSSPNKVIRTSYDSIKNIGLSIGFANILPEYIHSVVTTGVVYSLLEAFLKEQRSSKIKLNESPLSIFLKV